MKKSSQEKYELLKKELESKLKRKLSQDEDYQIHYLSKQNDKEFIVYANLFRELNKEVNYCMTSPNEINNVVTFIEGQIFLQNSKENLNKEEKEKLINSLLDQVIAGKAKEFSSFVHIISHYINERFLNSSNKE